MERRINGSLRRLLPKAFFKRPRRLTIDLHLRVLRAVVHLQASERGMAVGRERNDG
jgi:hypothetical protein